MKLSRNFITSFVSVDLHTQTTGCFLNRSIPIKNYGSPVTYLLCNLPVKSICTSWPGSVDVGSLIFSVDSNWYFNFLPELMHAVHVLHLFPMFFFISGHQNMLLSASIFVETGCPKCNASTIGHFSSSGNTILSPANNNPNRSVISLKTEVKSSGGLSFWLLRTHIFSCKVSDQPKFRVSEFFNQS